MNNAFQWRTGEPSIFLRADPSKSKQQQSNEIAWMDGRQKNHRGVEPSLKRRMTERMQLPLEAMYEYRMDGATWAAVAEKFGVCTNTARDRVLEAYPGMPKLLPKGTRQ